MFTYRPLQACESDAAKKRPSRAVMMNCYCQRERPSPYTLLLLSLGKREIRELNGGNDYKGPDFSTPKKLPLHSFV